MRELEVVHHSARSGFIWVKAHFKKCRCDPRKVDFPSVLLILVQVQYTHSTYISKHNNSEEEAILLFKKDLNC